MNTLKNIFNEAAKRDWPQAMALGYVTCTTFPVIGGTAALIAGISAAHITGALLDKDDQNRLFFEKSALYTIAGSIVLAASSGAGMLVTVGLAIPAGLALMSAGLYADSLRRVAAGRSEMHVPLDDGESLHITKDNLAPSLVKLGAHAISDTLAPPKTGATKAMGMKHAGDNADRALMSYALSHSLNRM